MGKSFNPEKHGMAVCFECNGKGRIPNDSKGIEVCPKCGGFGYIKKEEDSIKKYDGGFPVVKRQ